MDHPIKFKHLQAGDEGFKQSADLERSAIELNKGKPVWSHSQPEEMMGFLNIKGPSCEASFP